MYKKSRMNVGINLQSYHAHDKYWETLKLGDTIIGRAGASPPNRTTGPRCLYSYIYVFMYLSGPCARYC